MFTVSSEYIIVRNTQLPTLQAWGHDTKVQKLYKNLPPVEVKCTDVSLWKILLNFIAHM